LAGSQLQIFSAKIRKACESNSRLHRGTESRREEIVYILIHTH